AAGYHEVIVARTGLASPRSLKDPDGNRIQLVPPGTFGVTQIAMKLRVRALVAHSRFYADALGLDEIPGHSRAAFRAGDTLLICEDSEEAPAEAAFEGQGWRYITFQVFKVDEEHAHILAHGGREAMAPRTLGTTARISMVRDPDGNWIEISQRASITGS